MKPARFNRVIHRWASMVIALPLLIVIVAGLLLLFKKHIAWIQPPAQRGATKDLSLGFDQVLEIARSVPAAEIADWDDIDRLDVRPSKEMLKVRANNRWEIQIDAASGEILQVAYRRSDLIESLHDGSFFHDKIELFVFLPSAVILLLLWVTGIYLFVFPYLVRRNWRRTAPDPGPHTAD